MAQLAPHQTELEPRDFSDAPRLRLRAVHFGNYRLTELEASLDEVAAARLNVIQWETRGRLALPALGPALHAAPIASDAIREVLVEAAKRQILVVPAIKLLTHQEKLLGKGSPSSSCPGETILACVEQVFPGVMLPGATEYDPTYITPAGEHILDAFVFPVLDELVELFSHVDAVVAVVVGHDEAKTGRLKGLAEDLGGGITAAKLFADHLLAVHDHLAAKGVRTVAWADLLLDPRSPVFEGFDGSGMHGHRDDLADALPLLEDAEPENLVLGDWHYKATVADFPTNDVLAASGIPVAGATWKDDTVVRNFTRDEVLLGGLGMIATVWGAPTFWSAGNEHLVAYSGDTFWTGGTPSVAANSWPHSSEIIITDGSGTMISQANRGDWINVWIKAIDQETPTPDLTDFGLYRYRDGDWSAAGAVAAYEPAGPGWGFDYSWRMRWQIPADDPRGMKGLAVFFADAEGLPSYTKHENAIFIDAGSISQNLVVNSGYEAPIGTLNGDWTVGSPTGMTAARSTAEAHTGAASFCLEVITPCIDCAYNTFQIRQTIDVSQAGSRHFALSYWFRSAGRDGVEVAYVDAVALDADKDYLCWPGSTGAHCHVKPLANDRSAEQDHDWRPASELITVPDQTEYLMLRLRRAGSGSTPTGQVCFDDIILQAIDI